MARKGKPPADSPKSAKAKRGAKAPETPKAERTQLARKPRCGAERRDKKPCAGSPMANGRCRMHGGASTGPPTGNQNARTHGLFSKSLDPIGAEVYAATDLDDLDLGRTAAREGVRFTLAQIAQAYHWDADLDTAKGKLAHALRAMVETEEISRQHAEAIIGRMSLPSLDSLGKALSPIKGLIEELRKAANPDDRDAADQFAAAVDALIGRHVKPS